MGRYVAGASPPSFWHQALRGKDSGFVVSSSCQGHVEELWGLATHPSQAQFVTCGQDKLVHLWSAESHQPLWSRIIEVRGQEGWQTILTEPLVLSVSGLSASDRTYAWSF